MHIASRAECLARRPYDKNLTAAESIRRLDLYTKVIELGLESDQRDMFDLASDSNRWERPMESAGAAGPHPSDTEERAPKKQALAWQRTAFEGMLLGTNAPHASYATHSGSQSQPSHSAHVANYQGPSLDHMTDSPLLDVPTAMGTTSDMDFTHGPTATQQDWIQDQYPAPDSGQFSNFAPTTGSYPSLQGTSTSDFGAHTSTENHSQNDTVFDQLTGASGSHSYTGSMPAGHTSPRSQPAPLGQVTGAPATALIPQPAQPSAVSVPSKAHTRWEPSDKVKILLFWLGPRAPSYYPTIAFLATMPSKVGDKGPDPLWTQLWEDFFGCSRSLSTILGQWTELMNAYCEIVAHETNDDRDEMTDPELPERIRPRFTHDWYVGKTYVKAIDALSWFGDQTVPGGWFPMIHHRVKDHPTIFKTVSQIRQKLAAASAQPSDPAPVAPSVTPSRREISSRSDSSAVRFPVRAPSQIGSMTGSRHRPSQLSQASFMPEDQSDLPDFPPAPGFSNTSNSEPPVVSGVKRNYATLMEVNRHSDHVSKARIDLAAKQSLVLAAEAKEREANAVRTLVAAELELLEFQKGVVAMYYGKLPPGDAANEYLSALLKSFLERDFPVNKIKELKAGLPSGSPPEIPPGEPSNAPGLSGSVI